MENAAPKYSSLVVKVSTNYIIHSHKTIDELSIKDFTEQYKYSDIDIKAGFSPSLSLSL